MALKTAQEMMELTQKAIEAVLVGGQSYNAFGRSVTRADLATLRKEYEHFKAEAEREENGRDRRGHPFVE